MKTLFSRFKEGLKRTTPTFYSILGEGGGIFGGKTLDASSIEELEEALYGADFGVETTSRILEEIRSAFQKEKELRGQEAARIGAAVLRQTMEGAEGRLQPNEHVPEVICLVGVNGSGKTTTAAKLAHFFIGEGRTTLLGACDTFRAAANEQIKSWSELLEVDLVASHYGADAGAVAFDAYQAAASRGREILVLDTAGRLHTKGNLMEELKKIRRVLGKLNEDAPHHSWLVVDGSLGTNSIEQARVFHRDFGLTGLIITKLDGTSRGGALAGIFHELKLPIYFVGLGEQPEDLQPFSVENYANAIFGLAGEET